MAEHPLSLTLEEIYHGGMKAVECPRTIIDGVSGHNMPVTELLNVRITPGVREGTRCAPPHSQAAGKCFSGVPPYDVSTFCAPCRVHALSLQGLPSSLRIPLTPLRIGDGLCNSFTGLVASEPG